MAIREIVYYPDAPLQEKAAPITDFGRNLANLVRDMYETMHDSEGVGLAGPQVGVNRRIMVIGPPDEADFCLINPELSDFEGEVDGEEGCLSLPGLFATVRRAEKIHVRAQDETGAPVEFDVRGFTARIIQHEFDHLEGKVFPDRVDILSREALMREWTDRRRELLADA